MTDEHAWFRARIEAHLTGLLDEDDDARFRQHARGCTACGQRLALVLEDDEPAANSAGHLPASLVAAWPRASRALRGIERTLAATHLARCAECRDELERLGYPPRLGPEPEDKPRPMPR